jgi:hypothetical protein
MMIYVLLQNRQCQHGSNSAVTEGVAVHSSNKAISEIIVKNNIPGMFVSMHFAFAVVIYIALTMLTGIIIV